MVSSSRKRRRKVAAHARSEIFREKSVNPWVEAVKWTALSFIKELVSKASAIAVGALAAWALRWWAS